MIKIDFNCLYKKQLYKSLLIVCVFIAHLFFIPNTFAQDKKMMQNYEDDLNELFETAFTAPTDNERFNANEQAMVLLEEALAQPKSFPFDWTNLKRISVLKPTDNKFKIFTWAILRDDAEYDCFGYMQVLNEKTNEYEAFALIDRSEEITNQEEAVLDEKNWYGAIYYDLITNKYNDKTYYTLLGWSGVGPIKQRKVIEPITFKGTSPKPIFGQAVFYKSKAQRRIVFEYSKETSMMLRYDEQYYVVKERKRDPKGKAYFEDKKIKEKLIVFDLLEPMHPGMEGVTQYYYPAGNESGYRFEDGRWRLEKEVQTLLPRSKKYDVESIYKNNPPKNSTIYSN